MFTGGGYNSAPYTGPLTDSYRPPLPGMSGLFASLGGLPLISRSLPLPPRHLRPEPPPAKGRAHSFTVEEILKNDTKSTRSCSSNNGIGSNAGGDDHRACPQSSSNAVSGRTFSKVVPHDSNSLPIIVSSLYGTIAPAFAHQTRHGIDIARKSADIDRNSSQYNIDIPDKSNCRKERDYKLCDSREEIKQEKHSEDCNGDSNCPCFSSPSSLTTVSYKEPKETDTSIDVESSVKTSQLDYPDSTHCLNQTGTRAFDRSTSSYSNGNQSFNLLESFSKRDVAEDYINRNDIMHYKSISTTVNDDLIAPYVHKLNHNKNFPHPYLPSQYYTNKSHSSILPASKPCGVGPSSLASPTPYSAASVFSNCSSYSSFSSLTPSSSQFHHYPPLHLPSRPSPLPFPFSFTPSIPVELPPTLRPSPTSTPPSSPPPVSQSPISGVYAKRISDTKLKIVNHNSSF